jgi:hypothetical protein
MRAAAVLIALGLALPPVEAGSKPKVDLDLETEIVPGSPSPGGRGELRLTLGLPAGIVLNRYPGITFTPEGTEGLVFDEEKVHVGSPKPLKNPDDFYFDELEPLVVGFTVAQGSAGTLELSGELKYFYCVKKSGYCAPGKQKVSVGVPLAAR